MVIFSKILRHKKSFRRITQDKQYSPLVSVFLPPVSRIYSCCIKQGKNLEIWFLLQGTRIIFYDFAKIPFFGFLNNRAGLCICLPLQQPRRSLLDREAGDPQADPSAYRNLYHNLVLTLHARTFGMFAPWPQLSCNR